MELYFRFGTKGSLEVKDENRDRIDVKKDSTMYWYTKLGLQTCGCRDDYVPHPKFFALAKVVRI